MLRIIEASYSCEEVDKDSDSYASTLERHQKSVAKKCNNRDHCELEAKEENFPHFEGCERKLRWFHIIIELILLIRVWSLQHLKNHVQMS